MAETKRKPRPEWLACRKNFPEISKEERSRRGKINGKKSGEVRRRKKAMKEAMQMLLELPAVDSKVKMDMIKRGIPAEDITNLDILVNSLWKQAAKGDVSALREIRNLIGEDTNTELARIRREEFELKKKLIGLDDDEEPSSLKIEIIRAAKKQ